MVEKYPKVLLRKVNIVDWESPAAAQAHKEFGLEGLPHVRVYGATGSLLADFMGADIDGIEAAVRKGTN